MLYVLLSSGKLYKLSGSQWLAVHWQLLDTSSNVVWPNVVLCTLLKWLSALRSPVHVHAEICCAISAHLTFKITLISKLLYIPYLPLHLCPVLDSPHILVTHSVMISIV